MFNRYILLLIIPFAFTSCKREPVFSEVKVNNRYSMSIPDYLQPCTDLHKDASMQYQNVEKDIYAMVIDEKKKTMQNYSLDYDIDTYFNNIFKANGSGVAVMFSKRVGMFWNRFTENWGSAAYGILMKEISDSKVEHNTFTSNTMGIFMDGTSRIFTSQNIF